MTKKSCYGGKKSKKPKSKKTRSKGNKKECNGVMIIEMGLAPKVNEIDQGHIPHHLKKHHISNSHVGKRKMTKKLRGNKSKSRSMSK